MTTNLWILLIALASAIGSGMIGLFLVVRKMSMLTDAISHTVLFGIVIGFIITKNVNSPLLIVFAGFAGLLTAWLVELLVRTKKTTADAATGVVFPLLFAIGILILSTEKYKSAHICEENVFLGQLELAAFEQLTIFGKDIMPKSLFISLIILLINTIFIVVLFKELKIVSFDSGLAKVLGISPIVIHYLLMAFISVNAVTAFNVVGAVMVVSLMVGPGATALLITKDLKHTLILTIMIAAFNVFLGWLIGYYFVAPMAGTISVVTLIVFLIVMVLNPKNGMISTIIKRHNLKTIYQILAIVIHIEHHEEKQRERLTVENIRTGFNWSDKEFSRLIKIATKNKYLEINGENILKLAPGSVMLKEKYL